MSCGGRTALNVAFAFDLSLCKPCAKKSRTCWHGIYGDVFGAQRQKDFLYLCHFGRKMILFSVFVCRHTSWWYIVVWRILSVLFHRPIVFEGEQICYKMRRLVDADLRTANDVDAGGEADGRFLGSKAEALDDASGSIGDGHFATGFTAESDGAGTERDLQ